MDGRQLPHWGAEIEATLMVIFSSYIKIKGPVRCSSSTQQGYKRRGLYKNYRKMFLPLWSFGFLIHLKSFEIGVLTALSVRIMVFWEVTTNSLLEIFYFSKELAAFIFMVVGLLRWKWVQVLLENFVPIYRNTRHYILELLHVGSVLSSSKMIVIPDPSWLLEETYLKIHLDQTGLNI
jgi:hypothetical protein